MPILNPADLTWNGKEVMALSEAVFESGFALPEITEFQTVLTDIVAKQQIAIMGRLNGLVGQGDGKCDPVSAPNTIDNSEKFWIPVMISDRLTSCWDELENTFFVWSLGKGLKKADLTGTDFANFVVERLIPEIWECVYRVTWFNDTNAAIEPAGVITAGTNLAYFNRIDGLWFQIFAIVAADANRKTAGIDTKNAQVSYVLQEFNDTDTTNRVVTKLLQDMRLKSDTRLRANANKVFVVTQSVADQYEVELIDSEKAYTTERLENGLMILKAGGITVIAFEFWDRIIREWEDNGVVWNLPHRALLFDPANVQIGTEEAGQMANVETIYDPVTKKFHIDFAFSIDAKVILDYEIQAAY